MHDIRKLGLQAFATPDGMTGSTQVQVMAREIDFVTSFGKTLQALLDILGITRMIRKEMLTRRSCNAIGAPSPTIFRRGWRRRRDSNVSVHSRGTDI